MQPSSGAAHNFDKADAYLDWYFSRGKKVTWCFGHSPTWAAQVAFQGTVSPYGLAGGSSPPASMTAWEDHVGAVATRYAGRGMTYETWNEPGSPGYFLGTNAEMVEMCRRGRAIAKAADPTCEWSSPAFSGLILGGNAQTWLNTADPGTGQRGVELIDSLTIHPYGMLPTWGLATSGGEDKFEAADLLRRMYGRPALPIHFGEIGISSANDAALAAWYALTPIQRYVGMFRRMLISASRGAASCIWYSLTSSLGLAGDFVGDKSGVALAMDSMHALGGKTIAAGGSFIAADGSYFGRFTDGTLITV